VTGKAKALVLRMVVCAIEGETGKLKSLHEKFMRESRLHVTIAEILEFKKEQRETA